MARAMVHSVTKHSWGASAGFGRLGLVFSFVKVDVAPPPLFSSWACSGDGETGIRAARSAAGSLGLSVRS